MFYRILSSLCLFSFFMVGPAIAQEREVPYWATIKTKELNLRVGPSREYKIEWVYKREGLPIKVVRVVDGWRLIRDIDGTQGWVSASLLSPRHGALIVGDGMAAMREAPADNGKLKWNLEPGVVGALGDCRAGYCELDVRGHKGWVKQARVWGAGAP